METIKYNSTEIKELEGILSRLIAERHADPRTRSRIEAQPEGYIRDFWSAVFTAWKTLDTNSFSSEVKLEATKNFLMKTRIHDHQDNLLTLDQKNVLWDSIDVLHYHQLHATSRAIQLKR